MFYTISPRAAACLIGLLSIATGVSASEANLCFHLYSNDGQVLMPSRLHLSDSRGKPVLSETLPSWRDHLVMPGKAEFYLEPGAYSYVIEKGHEFVPVTGDVNVSADRVADVRARLTRRTNLRREGWWSGDLHIHRRVEDIDLLMESEDLDMAPVITWWNKHNPWLAVPVPKETWRTTSSGRFYEVMAGEDEREGGALLFFNLKQPLDITEASREYPSPSYFLKQIAAYSQAWIDIEKPFWWDVPLWLASGEVDSIGIANNHMCRSSMLENEAWGRPRDVEQYPNPSGNGYWTQEIYYHVLNTGHRLPPSAGSASGVLPNPVGYNRVYVHCGDEFDRGGWWQGLREGRSFVTNGPLLRVQAGGQWPGHVFKSENRLVVPLKIELDANDLISELEIIHNGKVLTSIALPPEHHHELQTRIQIDTSGWFLIRTIVDHSKTFRFASTAPFYVELDDQTKVVSRRSAQFFLDWVRERMERVKEPDPHRLEAILDYHRKAESYWQDILRSANTD